MMGTQGHQLEVSRHEYSRAVRVMTTPDWETAAGAGGDNASLFQKVGIFLLFLLFYYHFMVAVWGIAMSAFGSLSADLESQLFPLVSPDATQLRPSLLLSENPSACASKVTPVTATGLSHVGQKTLRVYSHTHFFFSHSHPFFSLHSRQVVRGNHPALCTSGAQNRYWAARGCVVVFLMCVCVCARACYVCANILILQAARGYVGFPRECVSVRACYVCANNTDTHGEVAL